MLSFHGKQEIKDKYVARMQAHYDADEIIQGKYWKNGKGCFIGCLMEHEDPHGKIESELQIPFMLARLLDRIFELQSASDAKEFALCVKDIPVGVDLSKVSWKFLHLLVTECIPQNDITRQVAKILENTMHGLPIDKKAAAAVADVAYAAAVVADDDDDAAVAYAAAAVYYAAAAVVADVAYDDDDAASYAIVYAAKNQSAKTIADKIVQLIKECK